MSAHYLVFFGVHAMVAIMAATHALLNKRDPRSAWGWIAACWLFPYAGAALYYLFGMNRVERLAQRLRGPRRPAPIPGGDINPPATRQSDATGVRELVRLGEALTGWPLVRGNRIEPLFNGEQAYPAMLEAIRGARRSICLSTYIYFHDIVGEQFAAALSEARQRNVDVRVLLDGMADVFYRPRGSALLESRGLRPALFLPLRWWPPLFHINLRNHRKLLLVDEEVAFTGGMNIAAHHLLNLPQRHHVEDLHFRIRGPLTRQMADAYAADWRFVTEENTAASQTPPPAAGDAIARVITSGPSEGRDILMLILIGALASAHHRAWIMTPYLVPSPALVSALQAAALRGVDVSIILPQRSDHPWIDWATRNLLAPLLQHQVRIYYRPAPFAHTKLFLVDDDYVQFGSANIDTRSLRLNFELVVEAFDPRLVEKLTRHFEEVRNRSEAVTLREIEARSLPVRLRDAISWLFSPYF
ncbi:MAG TPA: phospholipase D-like domain-containing protein [Gammaproteobacteria bacterium]|nr:phospholipase D-like domain-containing protein [Gammaproteobacteria bacterium]